MAETEPPASANIYSYLLNLCGEGEVLLRGPDSEVFIAKRYDDFDANYSTYVQAKFNFPHGQTTFLIDPGGVLYAWSIPYNVFSGGIPSKVWIADLNSDKNRELVATGLIGIIKQHSPIS